MKKTLLAGMLFLGLGANAQLSNGSIAPNFTVNAYQPSLQTAGMNGNGTYTLYDYLDAGYTVILDVSATWCGPCWNYHLTNALDDLYAAHGPAGHPGVNANTTDDVMVIWIEGDGTTADATMLDGSGAIGNWINPTGSHEVQFPMANPPSALANTINNDFSIAYFPTVYRICPNRTVTEVGAVSATNLYAGINSCPPPANQPIDVALMQYTGEDKSCNGTFSPSVKIQNNGTSPLTSVQVELKNPQGEVISTGSFNGNLNTYAIQEINCSTITGFSSGLVTVSVISNNDANSSNNTLQVNFRSADEVGTSILVKVYTDNYPAETTWEIRSSSSNTLVAQGGPYQGNGSSAGGADALKTKEHNIALPDVEDCYKIILKDSYGDGLAYGTNPAGQYGLEVFFNNTSIVNMNVGSFGSQITENAAFIVNPTLLDVEIDEKTNSISVYPNPATDVINVAFEATSTDYAVVLMDLQGRTVYTKTLSNASGSQSIAIPVADFAKGSYIVKVSSNGLSTVQNVVIK